MHLLVFFAVTLLCAAHCAAQCPSPVEKRGVDAAGIKAILSKHNELRAKVANGKQGSLPKAADMLEMVWDNKVAEKVQAWAEKCKFEHDKEGDRDTGRGYTGQNIAWASNQDPNPDWAGIIQMFYDEVKDFDSNTIDKYAFDPKTGHFTQVIWANTYQIGCGYIRYKQKSNYIHLYGCDYLPGGNFIGQSIYQRGNPCTKCGGCGSISGLCKK